MTLQEFTDEFRFKYDAASNGGPDMNNYEISLCLTKAQADIIHEAYMQYETAEINKRILAPLLKEHSSTIVNYSDSFVKFKTFLVSLPLDLKFILRDEVKLSNCNTEVKIEVTDFDHLSESLNNPFKQPNKRKVIRADHDKYNAKIYSVEELSSYKFKYIKQETPIITTAFDTDPELMGDETISGLNNPTTSVLPDFIHDDIVDRAVILAIKTTRANSIQTQTSIK